MNIKKYILPALGVVALTACDQEAINTNVHGVTDEALRTGGLEYGAALLNMQQEIISIGAPSLTTGPGNDLQATDLISTGNYIGYFGNNNNWGKSIEASWAFPDHRVNYIFEQLYTKTIQPWQDIYKLAKDSKQLKDKRTLAIANITKVIALLRTTDTFGPIVYSEIGNGNITPTPDAQEVVYKGMLKELSDAVSELRDAREPILAKYDLVYDGDPKAWLRLANSLMLRLAVRIHFVDETTAREYIAKATDPANGGLITDKSQEAKVASSAKLPLRSPYIASVDEYGETRMGATIWSYLFGYQDPRGDAMFTKVQLANASNFVPIAPTNDNGKSERIGQVTSKPRATEQAVVYWFRASETKFLLAEAALYNLYTGSPETLYKEGITASFDEQGVSGVSTYLNNTRMPEALKSPYNVATTSYLPYTDDITSGNVTPQWSNSDTQEKKLQKIITQKYIALYPNAIEAWTEYRRTGYPYIMKPKDAEAPSRVGAKPEDKLRAPERMIYASTVYASNPNMAKVKELLGGLDQGNVKLWWVRANRPVQ